MSIVYSFIFALELIFLIDFALVFLNKHFKLRLYLICCILITVGLAYFQILSGWIGLLVVCTIPIVLFFLYELWLFFSKHSKDFEDVDCGKSMLYAKKKVMLIIPHQDDEINVLGGVFEEYLKYGSELYPVYVISNGLVDGHRYYEALELSNRIGIPEKNITFLGYGSLREAKNNFPKLTKGVESHPAFREGQTYSRENIVRDLVDLMLSFKPDVIYGCDYDYHIDHHLVAVCVDEAIGKSLKKDDNFRPLIVKSYAYRTTWESYPDYYQENIASTKHRKAPVESYSWEKRLRLPVAAHMMNRSLLKSEIFKQYKVFKTQGACMRAACYNSDKVGWERSSHSLLYKANVSATSGDASKLTDFLIYDKLNFSDVDELPLLGAWIPDADDVVKEVKFSFKESTYIHHVVLYNNVSKLHRVNKVCLKFDTGFEQNALMNPEGYPTLIEVKQSCVGFSIRITESVGTFAGLTEVEAYSTETENHFKFIKIMNGAGDFIYDYWVKSLGDDILHLHTSGDIPAFSADTYKVNCGSSKCKVSSGEGSIHVKCPKNVKSTITVTSNDGLYSDTIIVYNPPILKRILNTIGQTIESMYYTIFIGDWHRKATSLSILAYFKRYFHVIRL